MTKEIENVLLCGLGGLGCVCAASIKNSTYGNLKVLVDESRYEIYSKTPSYFNDKPYNFEYILPSDTSFKADLAIIATKSGSLDEAIRNIKNFVYKDTVFISLLNGIGSEDKIAEKYSDKNVITSFFIGHSCIRSGRRIYQDGVYEIVAGIRNPYQKQALQRTADFFDKTRINYRISENINDEYWKKFIINIGINQVSAVTGKPLKEIKNDKESLMLMKSIMYETALIAKEAGIKNYKAIYDSALHFLLEELEDVIPSMLQDIMANRRTEADIFSGEILRLGLKYGVSTPENQKIYNQIKFLEAVSSR